MKQSIFVLIIFQLFFLANACQKADKGGNFEGGAEYKRSLSPGKPALTEADQTTASFSLEEQPSADETPQDSPPPAPPQEQPSQPSPKPIGGKTAQAPIARQIIKTANYRIQVKDVGNSARQANSLAIKHGGYVSDSELNNTSYETTIALSIRVPANRFDSLLDELGQEAIFTQYKRISSQDVTEEYVDITTRLKTKIAVRDRYVDILRTKAKTVKDVLDAEEQIRIIQEEIEAKEGRLRYLKDQVGMSTIRLELYQQIEFRPEPSAFHESFWVKLGTGLKNGWELMQGLVIGLVNIWPLVLLFGLFWWKRRWIWAKIRRKQG